ncbi:MAG: MerR family DNA-binding transcriptional regulator [Parvibaculaceae bacterium]|nr:MerR family DNA-binding transcriptional regulator [Parvibaculaceae bacterium]
MEQQLHTEAAGAPRRNGAAQCEAPGTTYSITELADEFGLTTRAIRFYEDKGLLKPERKGQTRIYHSRDRARLTLIVRGKNVGLALSEIKEILSLYDLSDGCETQNRVAVDKFRRRISQLHEQRREIDLQIKTLEESCARLEAQIERQVKEAGAAIAAKPAKTKKPEKAIV